jgi:hypothetical protein
LKYSAGAESQGVNLDQWKKSFEELGWGDDNRLVRQLFDEVNVHSIKILFLGYTFSAYAQRFVSDVCGLNPCLFSCV